MISLYREVPTRTTTKPSTCPTHELCGAPRHRLPVHALLWRDEGFRSPQSPNLPHAQAQRRAQAQAARACTALEAEPAKCLLSAACSKAWWMEPRLAVAHLSVASHHREHVHGVHQWMLRTCRGWNTSQPTYNENILHVKLQVVNGICICSCEERALLAACPDIGHYEH